MLVIRASWVGRLTPEQNLAEVCRASGTTEVLGRGIKHQQVGVSATFQGSALGGHHLCPDLPILAFFVFLAFFVLRFSLLFCAFLLSFPRISGVRQSGKSLLFSGDACFFAKKAGKGGSG